MLYLVMLLVTDEAPGIQLIYIYIYTLSAECLFIIYHKSKILIAIFTSKFRTQYFEELSLSVVRSLFMVLL